MLLLYLPRAEPSKFIEVPAFRRWGTAPLLWKSGLRAVSVSLRRGEESLGDAVLKCEHILESQEDFPSSVLHCKHENATKHPADVQEEGKTTFTLFFLQPGPPPSH